LAYFVCHNTQWPGEWAQAYHCGGGAAAMLLRGAGGPTVRAAVYNGAGEGWDEA